MDAEQKLSPLEAVRAAAEAKAAAEAEAEAAASALPKRDPTSPRTVDGAQLARLKYWSQRKPTVALMGEFSAGKSTLLNFLIEEDLLPTRATATELPPVWFSYGKSGSYYVTSAGDRVPLDRNDLAQVDRSARYIRLFVEAEILEHCDVIDTPGISDPNLAVETWRIAAGFANMVLWCTSATQAWRQTEYSAWTSLPERLRKHSILVVTRADKLTTDADKEKVNRRMARETQELFAGRVFMSTPNAVLAKAELANGTETPLWDESGAGPLLDNLVAQLEGVYEDRLEMFQRYELADGEAEVEYEAATPSVVYDAEPDEAEEVETEQGFDETPDEAVAVEESQDEFAPEADASAHVEAEVQPEAEVEAEEEVQPSAVEAEVEAEPAAEEPWVDMSSPEATVDLLDSGFELNEESNGDDTALTDATSSRDDTETDLADEPEVEERLSVASDDDSGDAEEVADEASDETQAVKKSVLEPTHGAYLKQSYEERQRTAPEPEDRAKWDQDLADALSGAAERDSSATTESDEVVAEPAASTDEALPSEVQLWREIVARFPENPSNNQIVSMIEQLLTEIYADKSPQKGNESDSGHATGGALDDPEGSKKDTTSGGWRRLA